MPDMTIRPGTVTPDFDLSAVTANAAAALVARLLQMNGLGESHRRALIELLRQFFYGWLESSDQLIELGFESAGNNLLQRDDEIAVLKTGPDGLVPAIRGMLGKELSVKIHAGQVHCKQGTTYVLSVCRGYVGFAGRTHYEADFEAIARSLWSDVDLEELLRVAAFYRAAYGGYGDLVARAYIDARLGRQVMHLAGFGGMTTAQQLVRATDLLTALHGGARVVE